MALVLGLGLLGVAVIGVVVAAPPSFLPVELVRRLRWVAGWVNPLTIILGIVVTPRETTAAVMLAAKRTGSDPNEVWRTCAGRRPTNLWEWRARRIARHVLARRREMEPTWTTQG